MGWFNKIAASPSNSAVGNIRRDMQDGLNSAETKSAANQLKGLDAGQTKEAIAKLSQGELKHIARQMNQPGFMSPDEKRDFFNEMARDLDGPSLARLAAAFDTTMSANVSKRGAGDDNIQMLANAVSQHGSSETKLEFVRNLAPKSSDQTGMAVGNGTRMYDPQAKAIATVISGMGNDPVAAEAALKSLSPDQLQSVINASTNHRKTDHVTPDNYLNPHQHETADKELLNNLLRVTSNIPDTCLQQAVFAAANTSQKEIRNAEFPPPRFTYSAN
jgi:hypothetical protein